MDKLGKLGSSVTKKLQGKHASNKNNNSGGQSLQAVVKEATAKTLRRPDAELNQQVRRRDAPVRERSVFRRGTQARARPRNRPASAA